MTEQPTQPAGAIDQPRARNWRDDGQSMWPVVAGTGIAVGIAVGIWLGIGAILSSLAGEGTGETGPYWRDLALGSGMLGSAFLFTRRGVASIPRTLRQVERMANMPMSSASIVMILQVVAALLLALLFPR